MAVIIDAFTGTIAGQPAYTSFNGGRTYSRILNGLGIRAPLDFCVQYLRENAISPNDYRDDYRQIAEEIGSRESVYFRTLGRDDRRDLTNHAYALEKIGKPLEDLAGIPMKDLQHQSKKYGMSYLVNRYFDGVETAEDGDLVVYYDQAAKAVHSGIYHQYSQPNQYSPTGGTVESRWVRGICGNPYVFQHDFFFLPRHFGDIAKFYRVKKTLSPLVTLLKHDGGPMYEARDGSFQFVRNAANEKIRSTIDKNTNPFDLVQIYPQIEYVSDIHFFGICFMYAMDKIFKSNYDAVEGKVSECDLLGVGQSKFLEEYFITTPTPQVGDLAVYSSSCGDRTHFGVYIDEDLIESKWGSAGVYRHPPFYVDTDCGNTLTYYRLKHA